MLENEKKENKKLKSFQELIEQINQSPQYNQSRKNQRVRGNVYKETNQRLVISENTAGRLPYLNNLSEKEKYYEVKELKSNMIQ